MPFLLDTGPIIAAANIRDEHHSRCLNLLETHPGPLLLPDVLVTEIGYMLALRGGHQAEADFLEDVADGVYDLVPFAKEDARRAAELVTKYSDLPLGTADAIVIATAERLGVTEIATVDRRHFSIVRPVHTPAFTLLP